MMKPQEQVTKLGYWVERLPNGIRRRSAGVREAIE